MTKTITIYSPIGTAVHEAPITDDAKVFRQLGGDYYIELSFNVASVLALPKGSYIQVPDPTTNIESKYALKKDASPEPISRVDGYKYVLKFYAGQHDMEACQIKWLAGERAELSFRLTTSLREYAKLIADNMNAYLNTDIWSYDESLDDKDMQEQSFEGISCWEAISNIANAFGVEWWVDHDEELTIHFGKCENEGVVTDIREGEIVNRFPAPKRGDDSNYGTRFYIFGGTQNVPENYREESADSTNNTTFHIAEKRICLRKFALSGQGVAMDYQPYYDAIKGLSTGEIVEKTIILHDIFPKNETTIGANDITIVNENIIGGQTPQPVYYLSVSDKPALLGTLGVTFTTGALAGRSFDAAIITESNGYKIKVIHTTENSGGSSLVAIPNANLRPDVGDKYILTGVELGKDKTTDAERELWNKGTELACKRANDTNVYDCPVNPVYCHNNDINFDLGDKVVLKGAHFGEDGRASRVQGYEKRLYAPYIATYNIGDNSIYSRTLKVYKDVSAPLLNAVDSTQRQNVNLKAQVSSLNSDEKFAAIIQRINNLEGDADDTADDVSVFGAKKYAKQLSDDIMGSTSDIAASLSLKGLQKAISPLIRMGGDRSIIGLLFCAGNNVSTNLLVPKPLAVFRPSNDFLCRYTIASGDKVIFYMGGEEYVKITQTNHASYLGAVVSIGVNVDSDDFYNAFSFTLKAGDWLVATPNGWKKINGSNVDGGSGADFDEVKNWVETKLESYAKMPTEQPVQDSILIYDGDNQTFKSSDVQISTTVQDIEYGADDKIPTCGQVAEFVEGAISQIDTGGGEVVDFANDLTGVVEATPEMFTFRPSAGDKSVRDESAVIRRIKGNTSVWGQLAFPSNYNSGGLQFKYNNDGTIELNGTKTSPVHIGMLANINAHKYLSVCEVLSMGNMETFSFGNLNNYYERSTFTGVGVKYLFVPGPTTTTNYIGLADVANGTTISNVVLRYQRFDLTAIFGAGNEPTTYEEFRQYYPDAYYPYCAPEIRSMRATGIETIGFNAFNGEYAEVIGGQAYYLGGAIDTAHFATEIGGELEEITIPENRLYAPPTNGYIYATGSDICINLSHSGVRNGEYEPYEENTLLFPDIAKYFPDGMHGIGDVYDEITIDRVVKRFGVVDLGTLDWFSNATNTAGVRRWESRLKISRPTQKTNEIPNIICLKYITGSGDNTYAKKDCISVSAAGAIRIFDSNYTTEADKAAFVASLQGVLLYYELAEPIYTPIDEPLQLAYEVDDFGTERMLSNAPSAPFKADIVYQFNAEGRIRDNSRNIEKLEKLVKQPSDWLEENPSSPAFIKNKPTMPTAIAPVTEVIVAYSLPSTLLPNVIHEVAIGLEAFTMPPLYQGDSRERNVYKMVFVAPEASKITFNYSVLWRDGVTPNWADAGNVVELTFTTMAEVTTILGEWKLYRK